MSRLEEIKNEVAQERGFKDWEHLNGSDLYDSDIERVAKKYAEECTKASLEKVSEKIKMVDLNSESKTAISECWVVDKKSITNPENIVLL